MAQRRDDRLRQLWEQVEDEYSTGRPAWDAVTLEVAKQVARGSENIALAPEGEDEPAAAYAQRLQEVQNRFPSFRFVPVDEDRYASGIGDRAFRVQDVVMLENPYEDFFRQSTDSDRLVAPALQPTQKDSLTSGLSMEMVPTMQASGSQNIDDGSTLYQAMEVYVEWIKENYYEPDIDDITEYAYTKIGQIETLKSRHDDVPQCEIDYDYIERMYRYWRQRPPKKSRNKKACNEKQERISRESVRHYIGELHRFFKWLHRTRAFSWRKPDDFEDINRSVPKDTNAIKKSIRSVDTFRLEELRLLNRYATPMERLYVMLALNCGFGAKEIATLTIGEVFLHQALSDEEQEIFDFPSTSADSFVTLVRNKTMIVGKYLLFQQTVQMLEWVMARRLKQRNPTPEQRLILNNNGMALDNQSSKGNPSRQIPNSFSRLKQRIGDDKNAIDNFPFKCLRKTAGDLIRRVSDGEVSGVFLLHGQPVKTDKLSGAYTNRPFGKVYDAIRRVEDYLQPVFAEALTDPTLEHPQAYTTRRSIDRIANLKKEGASVREIAEKTGKSRTTVHRHIQKLKQRGDLED